MYDYDVISIGGGPGGCASAIRSADMGKKVALVEYRIKNGIGGTCVNRGCIPTKALMQSANSYDELKKFKAYGINVGGASLDLNVINRRKNAVINNLSFGLESFIIKPRGIDLFKGMARFVDAHTVEVTIGEEKKVITGENIVIAVGSEPAYIPAFHIDGVKILTSNEIMDVHSLPESLLIVGAGAIGLEYGYMLDVFGVKVTIVEMMPDVIPALHEPLITNAVHKALVDRGIDVKTGAGISSIEVREDGNVVSTLSNGEKVVTEKVLVAIGRTLNTKDIGIENLGLEFEANGLIKTDGHMRTSIPNVYAVGDITVGPQLSDKAQRQGLVAAQNIAGVETGMNYEVVPSTVFMEPQIAMVGITESEAAEAGFETLVGVMPFSANEKAVAMQKITGMIKILARADDHRILGAQIFGHEACDLVAEIALAMEKQLTLDDIANCVHAHPTLTEIVHEVCKKALGVAFHRG